MGCMEFADNYNSPEPNREEDSPAHGHTYSDTSSSSSSSTPSSPETAALQFNEDLSKINEYRNQLNKTAQQGLSKGVTFRDPAKFKQGRGPSYEQYFKENPIIPNPLQKALSFFAGIAIAYVAVKGGRYLLSKISNLTPTVKEVSCHGLRESLSSTVKSTVTNSTSTNSAITSIIS